MPTDRSSGDSLLERLRQEVSRATRYDLPLSLMVFRVNVPDGCEGEADSLTHAATVLARAMVRDSDVVGPLGSAQFGVVANASGDGAVTVAEAVAGELGAFEFSAGGREVSICVCYGLSCLGDGAKTPGELLAAARAALEPIGPNVVLPGRINS